MTTPTLSRCAWRAACIAAVVAFVLWPQRAEARENIRTAFFAAYPAAVGSVLDTVPSRPQHCGVCHVDFAGGGSRNPYGLVVEGALQNFPSNPNGRRQAIESIAGQDADGDGYSALVEVTDTTSFGNTPTFPGLTPALLPLVSNVATTDIQGHLIPTAGNDTTPPSVTILEPLGGTVVGNQSALIRWIATDPESGVAGIDIALSLDGGATFRTIAGGLPNTGSWTWFPANRPTMTARLRVLATDNAFNVGVGDSPADFEITSPPGGLVPSTLRDFDQPGSQPFDAGAALNDPLSCSVCHGFYDAAVEPFANWQGSMMAHASRDLLTDATMVIANQDVPDSGDLCLRCHIPRGWLQGRSVPTDGSQMLLADRQGVACDFCHRMVDPIYDPLANPLEDAGILAALETAPTQFANAMYVIDPTGTRRGPFIDATTGHPILVSPFHREAAFCGTCHDVSNPAFEKDGQGNYVPNAFDAPATNFSSHHLAPVERTYSEWFFSAYNSPTGVFAPEFGGNRDFVASCQDCHMRDVTGQGCSLGDPPIRTDLPLHDMTGGSTWYMSLLPALFPNEVDPVAIQAGITRARYMLQHAAELDVLQSGDQLDVRVTNRSGHKLPTGYPEGRRMWLNIRFLDAQGAVLGESGAYDAGTGVLTIDAEARVYEAKPGVDETIAPLLGVAPGPTFHFVLNNKFFKDNRIPPEGFTNSAYESFGGAPVGASYADGQFWDDAAYGIPPGATDAVVRLYYQSTSKEFIEFLRDENTTNNVGQQLYDLWANNGRCPPELMAEVMLGLAPPSLVGDLNCDGVVSVSDIAGFVLALTDPAGYAAQFPACDIHAADVNADGFVTVSDIGGFVALLTGG